MNDVGRREKLSSLLRDGIGTSGEGGAVREALGLDGQAEDHDVARALVSAITKRDIEAIALVPELRTDPRPTREAAPVFAADSSFLGRLATKSGHGLSIGGLDDLRTLVCIVHAGTLRQRRAALLRLGERLAEPKGLPGDAVRDATAAVDGVRDVELAYERSIARSKLPGGLGRKARAEQEEWREMVPRVAEAVREYWDEELPDEPITGLPGDQRAQLLIRCRDLPAAVLDHIVAIIEDGSAERRVRLALLSSLRYAGDPRLVPALVTVLNGAEQELVVEAARVLGRIDDPRARPVLFAAYLRSVADVPKALLAGALAAQGDLRGADYVRKLLESNDEQVLIAALEALRTLGGPEDGESIAEQLVEHPDPLVASNAIKTLGRIADGRVLPRLGRLHDQTRVSAMHGEIEDALIAIRARMELRGEEIDEVARALSIEKRQADIAEQAAPWMVRWRSWKDYLIGHLWLMVGAIDRAVRRFESAAGRRSGWAPPLMAMALGYLSRKEHAQALASFRRAIEADRGRVERNPTVVRSLTWTFLRRAEEVERDGRVEIARGLLEEVLALDLRRAPSALRFELTRRFDALHKRVSS